MERFEWSMRCVNENEKSYTHRLPLFLMFAEQHVIRYKKILDASCCSCTIIIRKLEG